VIGELQRAFCGAQFGNDFPPFAHWGVPLWVPEVGGGIDPDKEAHDLIVSVFGGMSKSERNRLKARVHAAMSAQALMEGSRTRTAGARSAGASLIRICDAHRLAEPGWKARKRGLNWGVVPQGSIAHLPERITWSMLRSMCRRPA
jgi:hypothetical protein